MRYAQSVIDLVGNTPLVKLGPLATDVAPLVLAKVEYVNPGGSVKDRIAVKMIDRGRAVGRASSRAAPSSNPPAATPASVSPWWPSSAATAASSSARTRSARTSATCCAPTAPRWWCARPRWRPRTRTRTTRSRTGWSARRRAPGSPTSTPTRRTRPATTRRPARRSGRDTDGRITHFVTGVGTGGTITGTGRYLKEVSGGRVQVIGADPEGSVYSGGTGRPYLVEGVGEDFWPSAYDPSVTDEIIAVSDAESFDDHPQARPRGGPAGRRVLRHGRRRRSAVGAAG